MAAGQQLIVLRASIRRGTMSTPPTSNAWAASMTRLPPSPETNPMAPLSANLPKPLSLNEDNPVTTTNNSRLRSVARYVSFHPQAIACSTPLVSLYIEESGPADAQKSHADTGGKHDSIRQPRSGTSVAAIAGPEGVALFWVSRPHTPLVVLSHVSSRKSSAATVSSLAFQPNTKDSLLLAAARGSGVLVWDASGHSLSPLLGRLSMEPTMSLSDRITSISWKASSSQPLLATANATNACLWDLRTSLRANPSRPSVRLGTSRKVNADGTVTDRLVQIAASNKDEVATIDSGGTVHVFDVRMTDRAQGNSGELSSFSAFHHVGIGLEALLTNGEGTRWVTWGLDGPQSDAVVKVWCSGSPSNRNDSNSDSYWFMDTLPTTSPKASIEKSVTKSVQMQYRQIAEFFTPYLACARVCPDPFEDHVVTVGRIPGRGENGTNAWQAETWKLKDLASDGSVDDGDHRGVDKIASFEVFNASRTASMIGTSNDSLGSLRGAELALEPSRAAHGFLQHGNGHGVDLVLCCLSEKGYVTSHVVCEAPSPGSSDQKIESNSDRQDSPIRSRSQSVYSDRTRVYPSDGKRGRDTASMLRATSEPAQIGRIDPNDALFQESILERLLSTSTSRQETDLQYFAAGNEAPTDDTCPDDGSLTQFDMDVQGVSSRDVVEAPSPPIVHDDKDDAIENHIASRIDKERVPCPRLCGGSFSPGIGGIVCFNNGEVRKMWSWYEQSDPKRRVATLVGKGHTESLHSNVVASRLQGGSQHGDSSMFDSNPKELQPAHRQGCPRTLQDLEDMTDHARFSQWRSDESSGGESSIDDDSDDSLDEFSSGDEDDDFESRKRIFEKYFSASRETAQSSPSKKGEEKEQNAGLPPPRSPPRQKQPTSSTKSNEVAPGNAFIGPSSDLVPSVFVTYEQDALVFSGQSKALAYNWMLGEWYTAVDEEVRTHSTCGIERETGGSKSSDTFGWDERTVMLPRPRSAEYYVPLEKESQTGSSRGANMPTIMQRVQSDPMLSQVSPERQQKMNKNNPNLGSDDAPVHAGTYSVRPNRNESLVFLKKLVTHQRGDRQLQSLMSPPDSPLLPNKFSRHNKRSTSPGALLQTPSPTSIAVSEAQLGNPNLIDIPLGLYTLAEDRRSPRRGRLREEKLRDTCLHNAAVCNNFGQVEKANVWNLLSQMAENSLEDEHDNFNGWGGPYSGSLGRDLLSSFLRFYEAQGDIQMLATMVCVLGGGQQRKVGCSHLPESHQDRYDSYIRRYSDVLYGWRLMSIRAELNKHLSQQLLDPSGDDQFSVVGIAAWCGQCNEEVTADDGICRRCRNYAFRCSICSIAVRGLFSWCASCGHGGHTSHLMPWFVEHSVCPTGCGCMCVMVATTAESSEPIQPILGKVLNDTPELLIAGAGQLPLEECDAPRMVPGSLFQG